jgi:hypothetical protein
MRAYLRLDPNLPDRKSEYPDGAYRAYIDTLCFAEQQPQRGRFRSRRLLSVLLEKRSKWIPYLISHGDLTETDTGKLYVDGWDEWQEGDVTVTERMRRLRSRRRDVTPRDTPEVTVPTVYTPSSGKRLAVGGKQIAEAGGRNNGLPNGNAMGFRPRADEPGLWQGKGTHDGRHGESCQVCAPLATPPQSEVPSHAR